MFSDKKNNKKNIEPSAGQNRINEGTTLIGDISSTGFFRIDGTVKGNVKTPSKVVIGKLGNITGTLTCDSADIEGRFEGNLQVAGTLTLRSTAVVEGDVVVGKLAVEPGATLNASCIMQDGKTTVDVPSIDRERENVNGHSFNRQPRSKKNVTEAHEIIG